MQVIQGERGGLIKAWFDGVEVEPQAHAQLHNLAAMPFIHKHVAAMPDAHWGFGATVGSVFATKGAVIPAAVGVDIGCGMMAHRTSLMASDLPDNLFGLRTAIESRIPHGRTDNGGDNDRGAWSEPPPRVVAGFTESLRTDMQKIVDKHPQIERASRKAHKHGGTLGGGNHFVEVCLDEEDRVWVMLHSGSRGIGNTIGRYFIDKAKDEMRRWYVNLPDMDLAYLAEGSQYYNDYLFAVNWAQRFAAQNRNLMMDAAMSALSSVVTKTFITDEEAVNCHHNYVSHERHFGEDVLLTRKGAVHITPGKLGIIPGSMGARSFIVRGKEGLALAESFCSCSHGAGRSMSRKEAVRRFTIEDHIAATQGIECRKDEDVIDETPMAYKPIMAVMDAQNDHVEPVYMLRQVVCVKG